MSKARVRTLQALILGVPCLATHAKLSDIQSEMGEVYGVRKVRRGPRRRLLEVLHSTRALDSTLKSFVHHHRCYKPGQSNPKTLGAYLAALSGHTTVGLAQLDQQQQKRFQARIVDVRNLYMHEAGMFPLADADTDALLSEMHACLTVVSRL